MEVGVHGYDHVDYTLYEVGYIRYDLNAAASAIDSATGDWPTLFRPPYGFYDDNVINAAGDVGLATVMWTDNTWDYEYTKAEADALRWDTLDLARRNSVMLMHDVVATATALPNIISDLQGEGYTLVTVSTLAGGTLKPYTVNYEEG
jgi:peptidoglycan/xylan/chitin deacetylase (PgdA/CDA1 family)